RPTIYRFATNRSANYQPATYRTATYRPATNRPTIYRSATNRSATYRTVTYRAATVRERLSLTSVPFTWPSLQTVGVKPMPANPIDLLLPLLNDTPDLSALQNDATWSTIKKHAGSYGVAPLVAYSALTHVPP